MPPLLPDRSDLDEVISRSRPALEALRGARLLITGGTGFFGRWILSAVAHAHEDFDLSAIVLSRDPSRFLTATSALAHHPAIQLITGDVRTFEPPRQGFTHVIHAATDTNMVAAMDPMTLTDVIVRGTAHVLGLAQAAGARRFLYVSSGAVYGAPPADVLKVPETAFCAPETMDPRSAYGQAKRVAEQLCACAAGPSLEPVIARAFAFVGPGLPLDAHFAIGNFITDALARRPIHVQGDGKPLRSYLYAGDLTAWLFTLLAFGEPATAYNVGSDEAISIAAIARRIASLAGDESAVSITGARTAEGSRQIYVPDITRARALGLDVWTSLDEAILRTMRAAQRHGAMDGRGRQDNR